MRKSVCRSLEALALGIVLLIMIFSVRVHAGTAVMIKIPMDAQLIVKGVVVGDDQLAEISAKSGRIHEIATAQTGVTYGYKTYVVYDLASPQDVVVLDSKGGNISPVYAAEGIIEYAGGNSDLLNQVAGRVQSAATVYTNRTAGGCGNGELAKYFLTGSDAYNKAVASDAGRKWGQFVHIAGIQSVDVSEVYQYTPTAFTAKATVTAAATGGYTEQFDIYMLFQHNGKDYYVTNFTFMP